MKVNFHMHTRHSDGGRTVAELVFMAHAAGVRAMSVTDHNSVEATNDAAQLCKEAGICYVSGIEFSAAGGTEDGFPSRCAPHILGYGFCANTLQRFITQWKDTRFSVINDLIFDLRQAGLDIFEHQIVQSKGLPIEVFSKYFVAKELVECGYAANIDEAFVRWINAEPYSKYKVEKLTIATAIAAIHAAGGYAFWAHPQEFVHGGGTKGVLPNQTIAEIAKKMRALGLDGIEAYYQGFSEETTNFLVDLAQKLGLKASVGTDFHDEKALYGASIVSDEANRNQLFYQKSGIVVPPAVTDFFMTLGDGNCAD